MKKEEIQFQNNKAVCVFPDSIDTIPSAMKELGINTSHPVIVLIGGYIQEQHQEVTQIAMGAIAKVAEERAALIISGGTDLGIMALVSQVKARNHYGFSLVGVTIENLVTWPKGPRSRKFLLWGKKRWPLAQHYSHFVLVPGEEYGDESPWIVEIASYLSREHQSVTVLANGGGISRKDIELSLEYGRPVIALSGTGRLADELASEMNKPQNVIAVPAEEEKNIIDTIRKYL